MRYSVDRRNRFSASSRIRDLNTSTNILSICGIAIIVRNDAMILPYNANPMPDGIFGKDNRAGAFRLQAQAEGPVARPSVARVSAFDQKQTC